MPTINTNPRWWGWGVLAPAHGLDDCPDLWPALQKWLRIPQSSTNHQCPPAPLHDVHLCSSHLDAPLASSLRSILGDEAVRTDDPTRLAHSYGKSYGDLVRMRAGYVPNPPDAVVYPSDPSQIASVLTWASERGIAVIPFGGGTSLTGGVECTRSDRPVITLNMARLSQVLFVDTESMTARIQAGATGPEIESCLNSEGFTLGHFPQSFELSTLGGWIATRSVGRCAILYGGIDRLTQAIKVVTPTGLVETGAVHFTEPGPSLLHLLIGSEGSYGVIVEALMRIHRLPNARDYRIVRFSNWQDGVAACREIVLSNHLRPATLHLADPLEARILALTVPERCTRKGLLPGVLGRRPSLISSQGLSSEDVLLIAGFEGEPDWLKQQWSITLAICSGHGGAVSLKGADRFWECQLYRQPYLRDEMIARGIMVDTVTASSSWSDVCELYESVRGALSGAIATTGSGTGYLMTHLSNVHRHGTTLVTTYLATQTPDPSPLARQAQCETIRQAARDAILARGGLLAHNRLTEGNGLLGQTGHNRRFCARLHRSIKQTFDPVGILNPSLPDPL
ncbi:MAG: FAD-binding oxidoreductase [Chloroflexi bacterium]|nr:FAD-binding oxidoreductase [Chloroflexota bacterium]